MPPVPILASAQGSWTFPTLKLRVDDLDHKGVDLFFGAVNPKEVLRRAVEASFKWLYTPETTATNVKEILLILKSMDGVAHTSGSATHKQIHISLDYIVDTQDRAEHEITGVLVHEVVHCFQHIANDTCPGGLIEGIADYVRLKEGLAPPHWEKKGGDNWKAGYETTAYFLDWIEKTHGEGTIRRLNECMKGRDYNNSFFEEVTGTAVDDLWGKYCESLDKGEDEAEDEAEVGRPLEKWPMPQLLIRVDDLDHEGVDVFFAAGKPKDALREAVMASFNWLYTLESVPTKVKQIMLVLRPMAGVAHTMGTATHKEIHYSLDYIKQTKARARDEIMGVLVHEVVHCFQYTGRGTCPRGLVEGMADFVRLRAGLGPPHWKQSGGDRWDMGYDGTAYFLRWIDESFGNDSIKQLNSRMKHASYGPSFFNEVIGKSVDQLWSDYCSALKKTESAAEVTV